MTSKLRTEHYYTKHVPRTIAYPQIPIHRFLTDTVAAHPDYVAMTFNEVHTTYSELNDKVNRFALVLQQMGVKKGDRVAFVLVNSPTYVIAFFAVLKLGAIVVNLSVGIGGDELASCLNNAGAKVIITLDLFAQNLYKVIKQTTVKTVILHSVLGLEKKINIAEGMPKPQVFTDLLAAIESAGEPVADVFPADVAVLQYTSGSTGTPKAATLTHANIVASATQSDAWIDIQEVGNSAVMCLIPFFHVFGMLAGLLVSVLKAYRMILLPRMDAMDILSLMKLLETYQPICFPAVPSLWNAILSLPDEKAKIQLSSVKVAICGGSPLSSLAHEKFAALTGRRMMEAYGLSEASATHMTPYPGGGPAGSIGLPLPDTQARIMDIETGLRECPVGEVGELVVKGPQIMRGYWNNETLTADVLRDGWFYTRDMARMDKDGFFYIVDRKDDLIISNGFNIYPGQVEDVLKSHPKVKDAAVIGIPDRARGQAVMAVICLKEGLEPPAKEEFIRYCRENLPDYRVPKTIIFREAIPRDPAGKLLRRILKQEVNILH